MNSEVSLFNFITDEDFRTSLESDYAELQRCMLGQAWKAVHVLAGSIVEAVLMDYLVSQGIVQKQQALAMDLGRTIDQCKKAQIVSSKTADLSSAIKAYRNLIHPGRVIRLEEVVTPETAQVAVSVLKIIVGEVSKKKLENYGYTAEQIVTKIERDSSVEAIVPHLLKETNAIELERLLLTILPDRYLASLENEETPPHLRRALVLCFRTGFAQADDSLKKKVTKRFVSTLKEESDRAVMSYGTAFFRASDMRFLPASDISLVRDHLLSRIKDGPSTNVLRALSGIGEFLEKPYVIRYIDPLVKYATSARTSAPAARKALEEEHQYTSADIDKLIVKRLDRWVHTFEERGMPEQVRIVQEIKSVYELVPF